MADLYAFSYGKNRIPRTVVFEPLLIVAEIQGHEFLIHDTLQGTVVSGLRIIEIIGGECGVPLFHRSLYAFLVGGFSFCGAAGEDSFLEQFCLDEFHFCVRHQGKVHRSLCHTLVGEGSCYGR